MNGLDCKDIVRHSSWMVWTVKTLYGHSSWMVWTVKTLYGHSSWMVWTVKTLYGHSSWMVWTVKTLYGHSSWMVWTVVVSVCVSALPSHQPSVRLYRDNAWTSVRNCWQKEPMWICQMSMGMQIHEIIAVFVNVCLWLPLDAVTKCQVHCRFLSICLKCRWQVLSTWDVQSQNYVWFVE